MQGKLKKQKKNRLEDDSEEEEENNGIVTSLKLQQKELESLMMNVKSRKEEQLLKENKILSKRLNHLQKISRNGKRSKYQEEPPSSGDSSDDSEQENKKGGKGQQK